MNPAPFRVAPLDAKHARQNFHCGVAALDGYFQTQVTQDIRRRVTACFVAVQGATQIAGFYTLASSSVLLSALPETLARKLPRYPSIPVVRMGRLAVDQAFQSQGLGAALLSDALLRAARAEIAAFALVVDAKDATAARFYQHHGFIAMPTDPACCFLPLATVAGLS